MPTKKTKKPTTWWQSEYTSFDDDVTWYHGAQIYNPEVVAAQHDSDDILADIVYVALNGRHHNSSAIMTMAVVVIF